MATVLFYHIEFYFGQDDDFYLIRDEDIEREASPEEIEEFELKKKIESDAIKYNL